MYVHNRITYFLAEINNTASQAVWTRQKSKCKKYISSNDAVKCMEQLKASHNNKNLNVTVTQA